MNTEQLIQKLREEYIKFPLKREIIIRQIRALELATGKKLIKTAKLIHFDLLTNLTSCVLIYKWKLNTEVKNT